MYSGDGVNVFKVCFFSPHLKVLRKKIFHHLLALMLFQSFMGYFSFQWSTKGDIFEELKIDKEHKGYQG